MSKEELLAEINKLKEVQTSFFLAYKLTQESKMAYGQSPNFLPAAKKESKCMNRLEKIADAFWSKYFIPKELSWSNSADLDCAIAIAIMHFVRGVNTGKNPNYETWPELLLQAAAQGKQEGQG